MAAPAPTVPPMRAARSRAPATLVDVSKEDFPSLVKKNRGGANREALGNHVVGMRQAKAGGLLITVRGNSSQVEAVRVEITKTIGDGVGVRSLEQRSLIEIKDLDEWTTVRR